MGIDYWQLTKDFKDGDIVQRFFPDYSALSPFVGRVTAVHPGIGFCDVQWPFGNARVSADELVRVNPSVSRYLPPTLDQSHPTLDVQKARSASKALWRTIEVPPTFHKELSFLWMKGAGEVRAYDQLWQRYGSAYADDVLRDEVAKFYRVARNFVDLYLQSAPRSKVGAYWVAQNRQYRVSQQEVTSRKPSCPRCGTAMRRATYKMDKGARARLFACPKDLFLIKVDHLLGPMGTPVEW